MLKRLLLFIISFGILSTCCTLNCFAENYKLDDFLVSIAATDFETNQLVITPTIEEDLEILSEYLLDKDVSKSLDPTIENGFRTKEEALMFLKSKKHESGYYFEFTIKLKDSRLPIGNISFGLYDDFLIAPGYWLGKDFQRKGYASEACCELLKKIFDASDVKTIYISCNFENLASAKLANKILDYIQQNSKNFRSTRQQNKGHVEAMFEGRKISFHYFEFILSKEISESNTNIKVQPQS